MRARVPKNAGAPIPEGEDPETWWPLTSPDLPRKRLGREVGVFESRKLHETSRKDAVLKRRKDVVSKVTELAHPSARVRSVPSSQHALVPLSGSPRLRL
eukprot:843543-Prorocentrum_minimum.AAC.2